MATYVLIPGAGSDSWYWHLVVPELRERGHDVVAVDLPTEDDAAGLSEYADVVVDAIDARAAAGDGRRSRALSSDSARVAAAHPSDLILVAQSMAGFTAPLVCERVPVRLLVLVAAMVPLSGEPPGEWWANTGWEQALREQAERDGRPIDGDFDAMAQFFHDVAPDVAAEAFARGERRQSGTPFEKPWPLAAWPDVPTRFLLCRDDRFFPAAFMRRVVRERLGIAPDEMDGGHLPALSRPLELVDRLEGYRTGM